MGFFDFNKKINNTEPLQQKEDGNSFYSSFSTPFGKIGEGNLSLPYVRSYGEEKFVRFGSDNLFPQIINQIYHQSPLTSSIIDFKTNSVIGGGFELKPFAVATGIEKVAEYTFIKKNKFKKLIRTITRDLIMHGRVCIKVCENDKGEISFKRVGPEQVRINKQKTIITTAEDWALSSNIDSAPAYKKGLKESFYIYEIDSPGQDIYPIPSWCSSLNWAFVEAESSYLHKSNIINSIFPSFMIKLAKKFGSAEEQQQFKDTVDKAKGAPNAGRIMTFVANTVDQLPTIEAIPTNQNDKLFTQTDERIDAEVYRSHSIDPLIMGTRVSGKLGSGNELDKSYTIYEKNVVMPLREMIEEIGNDLLQIANINSEFIVTNYQIIGETIVDKTEIK